MPVSADGVNKNQNMLTSKSDSFLLRSETSLEVMETVDTESCDSVDPMVVSVSTRDTGGDLASIHSDLSGGGSSAGDVPDANSTLTSLQSNELVSRDKKFWVSKLAVFMLESFFLLPSLCKYVINSYCLLLLLCNF